MTAAAAAAAAAGIDHKPILLAAKKDCIPSVAPTADTVDFEGSRLYIAAGAHFAVPSAVDSAQ